MRRRDFVGIAGAAALSWPRSAWAQQPRVRRIGVMLTNAETDRDGHARLDAFRQGLQKLGWIESRNIQLDVRWGAGSPERARGYAAELVAAQCDVILANGTPPLAALRETTTSIPVVFAVVTDPVGAGFVQSLSRPGGNITVFSTFEPAIGNKWVELLREAAPGLQRIGCITDPAFKGFSAVLQEVESSAPKLGIEVSKIVLRERSDDIETHLSELGSKPNGGLIVFPTAINDIERRRIFELAGRHRLPAIYPFRHFAVDGGLMAYGFDPPDLFVRSAEYVDRILKGAKPADLPVQAPTQFDLVVNLKTAKAMGLPLAPTLLTRAEVIE
jgi:putative ABC transport system substrate-binding protein